MKKCGVFGVLLLSLTIILGCTVEKKIVIQNAEPEALFMTCQGVIREKLPTAKVSVDVDQRKIKISDPRTLDYPANIELKFFKETGSTIVWFRADGDKQRLENLQFILTQGLTPKPAPAPVAAPRPGRAVIGGDDAQIDVNKDGWIAPQEDNLYRQQQQLLKEREALQKETSQP